MKKEINVHIGEVKLAKKGEFLKTILGSCVGIGFIWKEKKICGLAHCLLPESPEKTFQITGRYVDLAIPSLIALMKIKPEDFSNIDVIVAGGGNMTSVEPTVPEKLVGASNLSVALRELKKLGIKPKVIEEGGINGKKMIIDSEDGSFKINDIPRISKVS